MSTFDPFFCIRCRRRSLSCSIIANSCSRIYDWSIGEDEGISWIYSPASDGDVVYNGVLLWVQSDRWFLEHVWSNQEDLTISDEKKVRYIFLMFCLSAEKFFTSKNSIGNRQDVGKGLLHVFYSDNNAQMAIGEDNRSMVETIVWWWVDEIFHRDEHRQKHLESMHGLIQGFLVLLERHNLIDENGMKNDRRTFFFPDVMSEEKKFREDRSARNNRFRRRDIWRKLDWDWWNIDEISTT